MRSNPNIHVENTNPNIHDIVPGESLYSINRDNHPDNNHNNQIIIDNMNNILPIEGNNLNNILPIEGNNLNNRPAIEDNNSDNKHPIKDNNLKNKNLNKKKLSESYNLKANEKFFKEFEPIKTEPIIFEKKNICVICESNLSKVIISPCGHRCLCQKCYINHKDKIKICPVCRTNIKDFLEKIYDV